MGDQIGRWNDAARCSVNYNNATQPSYQADYMSCWAEPDKFADMTDATNSYWLERNGWLNWQLPSQMDNDISYQGWTECMAQWGGNTDLKNQKDAADAIL